MVFRLRHPSIGSLLTFFQTITGSHSFTFIIGRPGNWATIFNDLFLGIYDNWGTSGKIYTILTNLQMSTYIKNDFCCIVVTKYAYLTDESNITTATKHIVLVIGTTTKQTKLTIKQLIKIWDNNFNVFVNVSISKKNFEVSVYKS